MDKKYEATLRKGVPPKEHYVNGGSVFGEIRMFEDGLYVIPCTDVPSRRFLLKATDEYSKKLIDGIKKELGFGIVGASVVDNEYGVLYLYFNNKDKSSAMVEFTKDGGMTV